MPKWLVIFLAVILALVGIGAVTVIMNATGWTVTSPGSERRTMSIESGQARCDKFYPGTTFLGWEDKDRGIAHCRGDGDGQRRGAIDDGRGGPAQDYAEPSYDHRPTRGRVAQSGQERCDEVHPGSKFVKWMNKATGEAHCRRPKSAVRG